MRCSTCMSTMVADGTTLICHNCGRVMDAQPLDIPDPGALARVLPNRPFWKSGAGRGLALAGLFLASLGLGGTGGWMLHERAVEAGTHSPTMALASLFSAGVFPSADPGQLPPLAGLVPVNGSRLDGRSLIGLHEDGRLDLQTWSPSGVLSAQTPLRLDMEGTLQAAALVEDGSLVTAFRTETRLELRATGQTGQTIWRRGFDLSTTGEGPIHLHPLGRDVALVYPGEARGQIATALISADGFLIWQRTVEGLANAELQVRTSPFEELVLVHDLPGTRELQVTTLAQSGLPGVSVRLDRDPSQTPLSVRVDDQGTALILLSGAPPRLVRVDALGTLKTAGPLVQLGSLEAGTPCVLQGAPNAVRLACARPTDIQMDRFDIMGEAPILLSRDQVPAQDVSRLFDLGADHLLVETAQEDGPGRILSVLTRPSAEAGTRPSAEAGESAPDN